MKRLDSLIVNVYFVKVVLMKLVYIVGHVMYFVIVVLIL